MEKLYEYYGKKVALTYTDGEVIRGVVDLYTSAADDEELHEESIVLLPERPSETGRWIYSLEIKAIRIIK